MWAGVRDWFAELGWTAALMGAVLLILLTIVMGSAALAALMGRRGAKRTREEFIQDVERLVDGTADRDLEDEFECVVLRDSELEAARREVCELIRSFRMSDMVAEAYGLPSSKEAAARIWAIIEKVKRGAD